MFAAEALDLVQIAVRRGAAEEFAVALGCAPPAPGQASRALGCDMLWLQPDTYLLAAPRGAMPALQALAPFAALVDQSDGRSAFTLSGPRARDVLAKGCRLDFHPRAFGPGRVAGATLAHVNAVIQQLDRDRPASSAGRESPVPGDRDRPASSAAREPPVPDDSLPEFRIIVFSSFSQHIAEWLEHATVTA